MCVAHGGWLFSYSQKQFLKQSTRIPVDTDALRLNLLWTAGFIVVQTAVNRFGVVVRHLPEGVFNNDRCIAAHSDFQIQNMLPFMLPEKIRIGCGSPVPALVLHEGIVYPEVWHDSFSMLRVSRNQFRRNPHGDPPAFGDDKHTLFVYYKALRGHGLHDPRFVIPGLLRGRALILKEAVVALCVEQAFFCRSLLSGTCDPRWW